MYSKKHYKPFFRQIRNRQLSKWPNLARLFIMSCMHTCANQCYVYIDTFFVNGIIDTDNLYLTA